MDYDTSHSDLTERAVCGVMNGQKRDDGLLAWVVVKMQLFLADTRWHHEEAAGRTTSEAQTLAQALKVPGDPAVEPEASAVSQAHGSGLVQLSFGRQQHTDCIF